MAVCAQKAGAERVVGVPQLHIGGVGGVADVQGIEHQKPTVIAIDQPLHQPPPTIVTHLVKIGQRQTGGLPFAEGQLCRPDFDPVIVIRRAIAQTIGAGGVDLAAVAVVIGHGCLPLGAECRAGRRGCCTIRDKGRRKSCGRLDKILARENP